MASEVKGAELDLTNNELLLVGMKGGFMDSDTIMLEHFQKCGFACIIKPKKKNASIFVIKAWSVL